MKTVSASCTSTLSYNPDPKSLKDYVEAYPICSGLFEVLCIIYRKRNLVREHILGQYRGNGKENGSDYVIIGCIYIYIGSDLLH